MVAEATALDGSMGNSTNGTLATDCDVFLDSTDGTIDNLVNKEGGLELLGDGGRLKVTFFFLEEVGGDS